MSENKKVIYFNHWFSSMECLIDDLKARYGDNIKIIASSSNMYATYKNIADTFLVTTATVPQWSACGFRQTFCSCCFPTFLGNLWIIRQELVARDFGSGESTEIAGILFVFPNFSTARMGQKARHPAAAGLFRGSQIMVYQPATVSRSISMPFAHCWQ